MISIIPLSLLMVAVYWMRYCLYERGTSILLPLFFTLFFIPKLNLLSISVLSTAGIRIDDILALILLIASLSSRSVRSNKYVKTGILLILLVSISNLISVLLGIIKGYDNELLYSVLVIVRKIEYFSFIFTGLYIAKRTNSFKELFIKEFTILYSGLAVIALLQVLGRCSYAVSGSEAGWFFAGAAVSTFNGYYEYGQFLCFGCIIYFCDYLNNRKPLSLFMTFFSIVMVMLTRSRTSLVAAFLLLIIVLAASIYNESSKRKVVLFSLGMTGTALAVLLFLLGVLGLESAGRFDTVKIGELVNLLITNLRSENFDTYVYMIRNYIPEEAIMKSATDTSASIRFFKWGAAIDGFRHNPLFGYGIGVTHVLDGNYVKLLAETGIVGFTSWMMVYGYYMKLCHKKKYCNQIAESTFFIMLAILISSVFIDMFEASRPMEFMWFAIGATIGIMEKDSAGLSYEINERCNNCFKGTICSNRVEKL